MNNVSIIERPILFNGEMVRAALDRRKQQTRRVMKVQPPSEDHVLCEVVSDTCKAKDSKVGYLNWQLEESPTSDGPYFKCPYGKRGDRLWVREKFTTLSYNNCDEEGDAYIYAESENGCAWSGECEGWRWRPSIFMPREACRILLEITKVSIERVQEISEEEAQGEGVRPIAVCDEDDDYVYNYAGPLPCVSGFRKLWDSINKKRGFGWVVNPWVWVVEFKVIEVKGETV